MASLLFLAYLTVILPLKKVLNFFKRINVDVVGSKFSLNFRDTWNRRCS